MTHDVETEVIRRIYINTEGVYLEVGPDADGLGLVEIRNSGSKPSEEWFGKVRFSVEPEFAKQLGQALLDAAGEAK